MKKVLLYTKLSCHLCHDAYLMLLDLTGEIPLEIELVDIGHSHNRALSDRYELRIPVLASLDSPQGVRELDWPFTPDDIRAFLAD
jgi:hypothetical protein